MQMSHVRVGRNFTYQVAAGSATAWYNDRILNRFMGSGANGYCIDEFDSDNFDHSGLGFFWRRARLGEQLRRTADPELWAFTPGTPTFGSGFKPR